MRCSRAMSCAVARTWPSGGRRTTKRRPSAPVTVNVRFDRPPAINSNVKGAAAPSTFSASHALTFARVEPTHRRDGSALAPNGRSARSADDPSDLAPVHGDHLHGLTGAGRVDHLPAADVHRDVADGVVVEDQVAGLRLVGRNVGDARRTAPRSSAAGRTPACAHAHIVRPEQSNDHRARRRRSDRRHRSGLIAAATAPVARGDDGRDSCGRRAAQAGGVGGSLAATRRARAGRRTAAGSTTAGRRHDEPPPDGAAATTRQPLGRAGLRAQLRSASWRPTLGPARLFLAISWPSSASACGLTLLRTRRSAPRRPPAGRRSSASCSACAWLVVEVGSLGLRS